MKTENTKFGINLISETEEDEKIIEQLHEAMNFDAGSDHICYTALDDDKRLIYHIINASHK